MANGILDLCATATGDTILSGQTCDYGGLFKVYYAKYSEIDWAAVNTGGWDDTTKQITAFTMVGAATWYEVGFDIESATLTSTLQDAAFYNNAVTLTVNGKSNANWGTITNLRAMCGDLVFQVYGRDCSGGRTIGVTRNSANDGFVKTYEPVKLMEHLDTYGTLTEKSRDEITFGCKSITPPLYSTATNADMVALL